MTTPQTRVRFAPSPTGALHIGGARTALYNWLAARGSGGTLVLRIEDTDRERSTPENVAQIIDALEWLELDWDEGPISQAERSERHRERIAELVDAGKAYPDPATSEDVKAWKAEHGNLGYRGEPRDVDGAAIRLRVPDEGEAVVADLIRGDVRFENRLTDDLVIARGDGTPLYNFAVAVDDADMGITEVIRGDDHLSNTPKQLLVLDALGAPAPRYAHLPLLHGPDGKKLSKRHGAASVQELREAGYLPAAVRNYLALLGWGTEDDTTILPTDELVRRFRVERVGRSSAIFDEQKLRWLNGRYMREMPLDEYAEAVARRLGAEGREEAVADPDLLRAACAITQDKAQTLAEVWPLIAFVFEAPVEDERAWTRFMKPEVEPALAAALEVIRSAEPFDAPTLERSLEPLVGRFAIKARDLYQPLRVAITGTSVSPGIFDSLAVLGRERVVERVEAALARLRQGSPSPAPE
ncbi:MAG TPA: glutamate--tRNA ligase [Solirubrobacterales bacterium]|nr:glutamate--tRNA ligase [Solirubrobacterales bacterium]